MHRRQRSKKKKVIRFRRSLFWDVDPKTIDPKKHARYVIERILDFGNDSDVKWMWGYYPVSLIRDVVLNSRGLNKQTRALWTLLTVKS
ncbi:MAG: hypothetical protein HY396_00320 [Candidatus Doudnabacteria bacterium]|nr:hypothetical protein [Candidatus Doudnabacteria bacterium]